MSLSLNLVDDRAERILRYTGTADDLAPGHIDADSPMRPTELLLTYTRRDLGAWMLDSIDVIGHRPRTDGTVNEGSRSRQRFHVSLDPFTVTTEYAVHAPPWLRGFAWSHRDPDAVAEAAGTPA